MGPVNVRRFRARIVPVYPSSCLASVRPRGRAKRGRPILETNGRKGARTAILVGVFVVAALLGRPAFGQLELRDDRGVAVKLDRSPQRIVSLLPSLTETICALGACDRLVGTDRFSNWPDSVTKLPKLGGIEDAQIERIVVLKPEVVLAWTSARVTDRLESLGIKGDLAQGQGTF